MNYFPVLKNVISAALDSCGFLEIFKYFVKMDEMFRTFGQWLLLNALEALDTFVFGSKIEYIVKITGFWMVDFDGAHCWNL